MNRFEREVSQRFEEVARVVSHRRIINNEFMLVVHAPNVAQYAIPGQFLEVLTGDSYTPLLRRPFSIFSADQETGTISIVYLARGSFTSGLARLNIGDNLSIIGPLGRGYRWHSTYPLHHILVAGGIGAPPLHFLAQTICRADAEQPMVVINGARTEELLVGIQEFSDLSLEVKLVTDDGSAGRKGLVIDELRELLNETRTNTPRVYACGPMPMLRAVAELTVSRGVDCQVSVETPMPCGIGICMGCTIGVNDFHDKENGRTALACTEGPVFDASAVIWPK